MFATVIGASASEEEAGAREALRRAREAGASRVELWFCEPAGRVRRMSLALERVDERLFASGLPIEASTFPGWGAGAALLPEPASLRLDASAGAPAAIFLCDVRRGDLRHPLDPRQTLAAGLRRLSGYACGDRLESSIECDLLLLENGRPAGEARVWEFLRDLAAAASAAGCAIDGFSAGPVDGQGRLSPRPLPCRAAADEACFARGLAGSLAARRGLEVSFGEASLTMTATHALYQERLDLFHDERGWSRLSPIARWYAGGVIYHAAALAALGNQIAPSELLLSCERAHAACRASARPGERASTSLRCRLARASSSPHLVVAAQLMAGLDGLDRRVEPRRDEDGAAEMISISAERRMTALDSDRAFLTCSGVFSNRLIDAWVKTP